MFRYSNNFLENKFTISSFLLEKLQVGFSSTHTWMKPKVHRNPEGTKIRLESMDNNWTRQG